MRTVGVFVCSVLATLAAPAGAAAAQRWASTASGRASGPCLAIDPCRLDAAIAGASTADEVVLMPGTYLVAAPLTPSARITIRGAVGRERPMLLGDAALLSSVLSVKTGATLRHLAVRATANGQDALTFEGGVAEDLVLSSASGDGAKVVGAPSGTVLRDSVVSTDAQGAGAAALKLRESGVSGDVMLRNVTAMAPGATGIRCEIFGGAATLVNVLVRGAAADVNASRNGSHCSATSSNFRIAASPTLTAGTGNQEVEPMFVDRAGGDYRPAAGSATIDAGTADALLGPTDPAWCPRASGAAPDIGAYEYSAAPCSPPAPEVPSAANPTPTPTPTPSADTDAQLPRGVPAPIQGATIVVSPGQGKVLVRRPGTTRFRTLDAGARVPVGSELDARAGRIKLVSAVTDGLQGGTFWGGRFTVRQRRDGSGMTSLVLAGGSFRGCSKARVASASRRKPPVRQLWAKDKGGRFRTYGHNSVATARGTRWLTEDSCDGTLTRVFEGAVAVRDVKRKRTKIVRAGHSFLAPR